LGLGQHLRPRMSMPLVAAICAVSQDRITDLHSTSPDNADKPPVAKKCKSCVEFNIYAPHLNDLRECTCDGSGCTADDPCSICEKFISGEMPIGRSCQEQSLDDEHAKDCYNCARHVLSSSQTFHRATAGAARVLVVSDTVSPARDKYFSPTPCAVCAPKVAKGIADCEGCREQNPDHEHSLYCFSCERYVIVSSQKPLGATRVVVEPDAISPESEKCIGGAPCSICKRLIAVGKTDDKRCRKRIYEHSHAKGCFHCLRRYFVVKKLLPFHPSIVTAARIAALAETPSGLAHTLVYSQPDNVACDRSGENGMLMWDLVAAGDVVLGCSSASTADDKVEDGFVAPLPALVYAGEDCTSAVPCSICKPLITMGEADCKDCRRREFDHLHAKRCFNCLRQYLLQSQESHVATVAAARIVGLKGVPRGMDVTPFHPMPADLRSDRRPENNALMWALIGTGEVIMSSAPTPSDTTGDSETEDDDAEDANDDNSSATTSPRSVSPEPEHMEIGSQQVEEDAQPPSPRPTSPQLESMKIAVLIEEGAQPPSLRPMSPEPEAMEILAQQVEDDAADEANDDNSSATASPRPDSPEPQPMDMVVFEEDAQPTSPRPATLEPERMQIVARQDEGTQPDSPRPMSPEPEPMENVARVEEDAEPPSPPATRGHKRKRRLSQCLSPTPEPRSSASPDPVPRTVRRPTHLPAFTYQPTRSPSPVAAHLDQYLLYPNNTLTASVVNLPPAVPFPNLSDIDFTVARRRRDHRAFLEGHEKRAFNVERANLQIEREGAYRRMQNLEREDDELRKAEVARLRREIERLESNDYY
jgi:hypothetical protein